VQKRIFWVDCLWAPSIEEFWRRWNPGMVKIILGLYKQFYKRSRSIGKARAMVFGLIMTYAINGILHDIFVYLFLREKEPTFLVFFTLQAFAILALKFTRQYTPAEYIPVPLRIFGTLIWILGSLIFACAVTA
jgi:D-alanyl-lipoteichoic acid acyltransferase DltB (MBOAT superfamily)